MPKNLRLLSERLPKSNYGNKAKKEKEESKHQVNRSVILAAKESLHSI